MILEQKEECFLPSHDPNLSHHPVSPDVSQLGVDNSVQNANSGGKAHDICESVSSVSPEGSIFSITAISQHLKELGYPENSIRSMLKCGQPNGIEMIRECSCSTDVVEMSYRCNLRTCPSCSKKRKRRIRRQFLPQLEALPRNRNGNMLYFFTISPANYSDPKEGLVHIRKSFNKFLRNKYIKERVKAGLYVTETKNKGKGWNVHIHAVIYGRRLDNQIRGKCRDCGQNLLKYDYQNDKLYCANSKCNSVNVERVGLPKVLSIWEKCSNRKANIHIQMQNSASFTLNYMLKYISANKDDFENELQVAQYIKITRKQKLFITFGLSKVVVTKVVRYCPKCKSPYSFLFDLQIVSLLKEIEKERIDHPPSKDWFS